MNNVHIMPNSVFTNPFIELVNSNFEKKDHFFLLYGNSEVFDIKEADNIIVIKKKLLDIVELLVMMNKSEKIYLHGMFSKLIVLLLFFQPWLLKRCYWVIWGGDLYYHDMRKKNTKSNIYEYLRKYVIKNMGGFITHIKGDYELAKEWYGAKGKYCYSFMYPSNLYKEYSLGDEIKPDDKVYIQIGNSADPSNNHIEVLGKLQKYKDRNIEIICPLSYGDKVYAEKVINYGTEIFGDKFVSITEFIPFNKYLEILASIDIAIFNHKRQQAMGNITTLLGLGKKVYIRQEITTWQFCIDHELKVYSANGYYEDLFENIDEKIKQKNIDNVKIKFSEGKLVEDWRLIFDA